MADALNAMCAICLRPSRGFGYQHFLKSPYPQYHFCSTTCLGKGVELARRNMGVIDKTDMERRAIKDARRLLAETLQELGLMEPFYNRSPDDIDRIIEACVDGFQDSMQRQSSNGDVPF